MNEAVFAHLKSKVEENPTIYGEAALTLDGMYIKKGVKYDQNSKSPVGYVDEGIKYTHMCINLNSWEHVCT